MRCDEGEPGEVGEDGGGVEVATQVGVVLSEYPLVGSLWPRPLLIDWGSGERVKIRRLGGGRR